MAYEGKPTSQEQELRELIGNWVEAVRSKNVDAVTAGYAKDFRLFDLLPPLAERGVAPLRAKWQMCFDSIEGELGYEMRELEVTAGADVAFAHCLSHISGSTKGGESIETWLRATVCYRKLDGRWQVVHEHASVPVDPVLGKALLDLKP